MPFFILLILSILSFQCMAQDRDPKIVIITTDGLRWQEVFKGMDSLIAVDRKFNQGDSIGIFKKYWDRTEAGRRQRLMPFFWGTVAKQGQLYGNRVFGNRVDNANPYWFSYPGYSELLTGHVDTLINTNDYPPNPHRNILEFFNSLPGYKNRVAAFGAWGAFDRILNEKRAGFPVVNAFDDNSVALSDSIMRLLNRMNQSSFKPFGMGETQDVFLHHQAFHYLKARKPKAFFISYGDTDEFAHHGDYKFYLDAAHQFDEWVGEIWAWIQSDPDYRDKTTLLITTDHGRGDAVKSQWTSHGKSVPDSHEMWMSLIGPKVKPIGEVKKEQQVFPRQLAAMLAQLAGQTFTADHEVSKPMVIEQR
jgi:hypothetical protein